MRQSDKNTVSAKGQLRESGDVSLLPGSREGLRVLFVGNSITLHDIKEDIGWPRTCGMAASAPELDYVHRMAEQIAAVTPAVFCICQVADWESNYTNGRTMLHQYEAARDFQADIMICRFVENCPDADFQHEAFQREYQQLLRYLDPRGTAKIVLSTGFWKKEGDTDILELGKKLGYPVVYLGDLGEDDAMKAIGQYAHEGVANHPGNLGMQTIAQRLLEPVLQWVREN